MKDSIDSRREDELLIMLEEMQDQIEMLENQIQATTLENSENKKMISKLSSENLKMKKELLNKSETIKSLNDRIGKLSTSDLVLKENEQLKKQMKESTQREMNMRKKVDNKMTELYAKEQDLDDREKEVADSEKHIRKRINQKVEKELQIKEKQIASVYKKYGDGLKRDYRNKEIKYMAAFIMSLVYGIAVTVIQMIKNKVFQSDLIKFAMRIADIGTWVKELFTKSAVFIWRLKLTENKVADIVIDLVILTLILAATVTVVLWAWKKINENMVPMVVVIMDRWMLGIVLFILGCNLFVGEYVKSIVSINLVIAIICELGISVGGRLAIKIIGMKAIKEFWDKVWPVVVGIVVLVMGMFFVGEVFYR